MSGLIEAIATDERTVVVTMPKHRAETWNRILDLKDRALDHPRDCVIDEFEVEMGMDMSVQIKLCNCDDDGGGPWMDCILWYNQKDSPHDYDCLEPGEGPVEGEFIFLANNKNSQCKITLIIQKGE